MIERLGESRSEDADCSVPVLSVSLPCWTKSFLLLDSAILAE